MIKYICDGHTFHKDWKCQRVSENDIPKNWITIKLNYSAEHNKDSYVKQSNGLKHFCSKACFTNYFFYNHPTFDELRFEYHTFKYGAGNPQEPEKTLEIKKNFKEYCEKFYEYCIDYIKDSLSVILELTKEEKEIYKREIK